MLYKLDPETNTLNEIETNEDMVLSLQDYKIFHPFAQKEGDWLLFENKYLKINRSFYF